MDAATPDTLSHGKRYPEAVKELCFFHWMQEDGNAERAYRSLVKQCTEDASDELPLPADLPEPHTIRRWSRNDGWAQRMTEMVAADWPHIQRYQTARLVQLTGRALDELDAIYDGERDHLKGPQIMVRSTISQFLIQALGLGVRNKGADLPTLASALPDDAVDAEPLTLQELQRRALAVVTDRRRG